MEQQKRAQQAADMYNDRQEMIKEKRANQAHDYENTTAENFEVAKTNHKLMQETEAHIKYLEEQEMLMLGKMQQTLARKQAAA